MRNFTKAKTHREISRVKGFDRNFYNKLTQKIGEITHHDTITGTSQRAVLRQEYNDIKVILNHAGQLNSDSLSKKLQELEGIYTANQLKASLSNLNERESGQVLNYTAIIHGELDLVYVVYNPHTSEIKEHAEFLSSTKELSISRWVSDKRIFEEAESEAFCYENPDRVQECEVIVKVDVPPL